MNLRTKKELVARMTGVGKERVLFDDSRLNEIKEALTRQDIRDLIQSKAIKIKEISGRRRIKKRKTKRREGKIKKTINKRKKKYMILTRKLRKTVADHKKSGAITQEQYLKLRKQIRASAFRSKNHMMENLGK